MVFGRGVGRGHRSGDHGLHFFDSRLGIIGHRAVIDRHLACHRVALAIGANVIVVASAAGIGTTCDLVSHLVLAYLAVGLLKLF